MKKPLAAVLAALTIAALAGCSTAAAAPRTFTMSGDLDLSLAGGSEAGAPCSGSDGYSDIKGGAQIVVTDGAAKTIAIGRLGDGQTGSFLSCVFAFKIPDVPAGEKFYKLEVARRGQLQYTEAEARKPLSLTLGDQ